MINQLENLKRKAYWNLPMVNTIPVASTITPRDFLRHAGYYLPPKNNFTVKFGRVSVLVSTNNYSRK